MRKGMGRSKMNIYPVFPPDGPPGISIVPFSSCDIGSQIRLVEGRYPGQRIYSLCGQGLETCKFPSGPETCKIRDIEVYFYVARINP